MADRIPIPMGIPWDPRDPGLSHSHAHLYIECTARACQQKIGPVCTAASVQAQFGLNQALPVGMGND